MIAWLNRPSTICGVSYGDVQVVGVVVDTVNLLDVAVTIVIASAVCALDGCYVVVLDWLTSDCGETAGIFSAICQCPCQVSDLFASYLVN